MLISPVDSKCFARLLNSLLFSTVYNAICFFPQHFFADLQFSFKIRVCSTLMILKLLLIPSILETASIYCQVIWIYLPQLAYGLSRTVFQRIILFTTHISFKNHVHFCYLHYGCDLILLYDEPFIYEKSDLDNRYSTQ